MRVCPGSRKIIHTTSLYSYSNLLERLLSDCHETFIEIYIFLIVNVELQFHMSVQHKEIYSEVQLKQPCCCIVVVIALHSCTILENVFLENIPCIYCHSWVLNVITLEYLSNFFIEILSVRYSSRVSWMIHLLPGPDVKELDIYSIPFTSILDCYTASRISRIKSFQIIV